MSRKEEKCNIISLRLSNKVDRLPNHTVVGQVQFEREAEHAEERGDLEQSSSGWIVRKCWEQSWVGKGYNEYTCLTIGYIDRRHSSVLGG